MITHKLRSLGALVVMVAFLTSTTPVSAAKTPPPEIPVIVKISPVSTSKGFSKIRVMIDKAAPGVSTSISINGEFTCTIKPSANSCVVSKVVSKYQMMVRARASKGLSKSRWTGNMQLKATATWVRDGYDTAGVKFPAPVDGSSKGRVLGTAPKWTKFQALKRSGVTSAGLHQARPKVLGVDVVFQVSGAVGLALSSASGSCGTNQSGLTSCAVAVAADGSNPSLFAPGSATPAIRDFYSAPNGKLYVVLLSPTVLVSGGSTCVLLTVNTDSGLPTCVDPAMNSVSMSMGYAFGAMANGNPPIQFDDSGNVYYSGVASGGFTFTLRKNVGGVISSLVNDNIMVRDFLVLGDGSVLIAGTTSSTQTWWFRKISTSGAITSILNGTQATFMRKFVDGNVYYGVQGSIVNNSNVSRYLVADGKVDDIPWMAGGQNFTPTEPATRNSLSGLCPVMMGASPYVSMFCSSSGSLVKYIFNVGTDRTYAVAAGYSGQTAELMQYYPTVSRENSVVKTITIAYQVNGKFVLTGLDASSKNIVTVYDPLTHQESVIYDGSNEVEIYSIGFVPSTGKVMFNGLRFSTGQVIVGDIAIS